MASLTEYKNSVAALRRGETLNYDQAEMHCRGRFFDILIRADDVTIAYEAHKAILLKKYSKMEDYILCTVFGFAGHLDSAGKIVGIVPVDAGPETRLVENEYPYHFTDDVAQFVFWSLKPMAIEDAKERVRADLVSRGYTEHCCAINVAFQTIPGLWHIHVIAKARTLS
jgi:hypothetical protein